MTTVVELASVFDEARKQEIISKRELNPNKRQADVVVHAHHLINVLEDLEHSLHTGKLRTTSVDLGEQHAVTQYIQLFKGELNGILEFVKYSDERAMVNSVLKEFEQTDLLKVINVVNSIVEVETDNKVIDIARFAKAREQLNIQ